MADLNAAGGVLGQPVELVTEDSADGVDNGEATARAVDDLLAQDLVAVVGPVSSGQLLGGQMRRLAEAGVLVISPSASAADFGQASDGLIGRLSPSAALQGLALAQAVAQDGATRVAVLARADDYGQDTATQLRDGLDTAGVELIEQVDYDQTAQSFAATIEQVAAASPDAVVLIGFDESITLLTELAAQGIGPADLPVWSGDGLLADTLPPPAIGVRGVRWAPPDDSAFVARLTEAHADLVETGYAAAAYDAVMTIALGSATAASDEGGQIAARLASITQPGGEPCSSAAGCLARVAEGVAITYDGALGISALGADNQPAGATYEVFAVAEDGRQRTIDTIQISSG